MQAVRLAENRAHSNQQCDADHDDRNTECHTLRPLAQRCETSRNRPHVYFLIHENHLPKMCCWPAVKVVFRHALATFFTTSPCVGYGWMVDANVFRPSPAFMASVNSFSSNRRHGPRRSWPPKCDPSLPPRGPLQSPSLPRRAPPGPPHLNDALRSTLCPLLLRLGF